MTCANGTHVGLVSSFGSLPFPMRQVFVLKRLALSAITHPPLLDQQTVSPPGSINLHISPQKDVEFENLGTNVEVVCNGTLEAVNTIWKLAQFHFHAPSEHRVDYGHYEAEMHFVFAAAGTSPPPSSLWFSISIGSLG
jgi:hypothetical protein